MSTTELRTKYYADIRPALVQELGLTNIMQAPGLAKIVINMGVGDGAQDSKVIDGAQQTLTAIAGQKAVVCRARKSIANFKLREGMPVGVRVTLRGARMWEFLERLIHIAIPRIRDFRGVNPKGFDPQGNFTMGIQEQLIFPEVAFDDIDRVRGMNVSIVFTNPTPAGGRALLVALGMPFRKTEPRPLTPVAA